METTSRDMRAIDASSNQTGLHHDDASSGYDSPDSVDCNEKTQRNRKKLHWACRKEFRFCVYVKINIYKINSTKKNTFRVIGCDIPIKRTTTTSTTKIRLH